MKTKINKSELMKKAWRIAKQAVTDFGGKVRDFFSESLKIAWREIKMTAEKTFYKLNMRAYAKDIADFHSYITKWEVSITEINEDIGDGDAEYPDQGYGDWWEVYESREEAEEELKVFVENHDDVVFI